MRAVPLSLRWLKRRKSSGIDQRKGLKQGVGQFVL